MSNLIIKSNNDATTRLTLLSKSGNSWICENYNNGELFTIFPSTVSHAYFWIDRDGNGYIRKDLHAYGDIYTSGKILNESGFYSSRLSADSSGLLILNAHDTNYSNVGNKTPNDDTTYRKGVLKNICQIAPDSEPAVIGRYWPNSYGFLFGNLYNTSEVNSEGLPRYCTLLRSNLGGSIGIFGTVDYNFYDYNILTGANYNSYSPSLTGGGASGTWGINITGTANLPAGFTVRHTSSTWGTISSNDHTLVTGWATNDDASIDFLCYPNRTELSVKIDGYFFQNEGKYKCLDTSGGSFVDGASLQFTGVSASVSGSTPTALSYGRLQSYGTLCINADTDNSGNEYIILTAGKGLSSSTSDGLAIGQSTLTWQGSSIITSGNIGSQSVNYANSSGYASSAGNADTVDGYHAGSFTGQTHLGGIGDYQEAVIGLFPIATSNNTGSANFASGRISCNRLNGLFPTYYVDFVMNDQYYGGGIANCIRQTNNIGGLTPCTFTYNGTRWAGFHQHIGSAQCNVNVFNGVSTHTPFMVVFYNHNDGSVYNSEIKNSLAYNTISESSTGFPAGITLNGGLWADGSIYGPSLPGGSGGRIFFLT